MWQYTTEGDSGANQRVKFFVTSNGELQVTRGNALDFEIFGCVTCEFEDFGCEVFEDGGDVDGSWNGSVP